MNILKRKKRINTRIPDSGILPLTGVLPYLKKKKNGQWVLHEPIDAVLDKL